MPKILTVEEARRLVAQPHLSPEERHELVRNLIQRDEGIKQLTRQATIILVALFKTLLLLTQQLSQIIPANDVEMMEQFTQVQRDLHQLAAFLSETQAQYTIH